eukprot:5858041-Pyramimonas_sp.AAC.1
MVAADIRPREASACVPVEGDEHEGVALHVGSDRAGAVVDCRSRGGAWGRTLGRGNVREDAHE